MAELDKIIVSAEGLVEQLFLNEHNFYNEVRPEWVEHIQKMSMANFRTLVKNVKNDVANFKKFERLKDLEFYDLDYTYAKRVILIHNISVPEGLNISNKHGSWGADWIVCLDSDISSINVENAKIRGETSAYKFAGCTIGNIKIYESKIGDFEFVSCEIANTKNGKIEILGSETGYFQFRGCKVGKIRIHRGSETGYFRVDNGSEIEDFELANSSADYFRIKGKSSIGNFVIKNGSKADEFSIEDCKMFNFTLTSGTVRIFSFKLCSLNKFTLFRNNKFDIFISGSRINWFILKECILGLESSISISDTEIFYLQMVKFAVVGNLFLRNVSPMAQSIKFISGTDEMSEIYEKVNAENEKNLPEIPTFLLYHSSLGKTEFTNCGLEGFRLNYSNSNLLDTFIVGGNLPNIQLQIVTKIEVDKDGKETLTFADESSSESPYQKASLFNQLKKILERAGDTYGSSLLQSEWADNQLKYLKLVKKEKFKSGKRGIISSILKRLLEFFVAIGRWFKKKMENNQINQDIFSFRINKYSNNHDENWLRALGWIVVFSVIFYLLFLYAHGILDINGEFDWELVGKYFAFLNPLNNTNFLEEKNKSIGWLIVVDFSAKLILGFLIYKFLRAFRKYGKK